MPANLMSLEELLETDLGYVTEGLQAELAEMAGTRLLITGGAGFLGYYLVQTALHWNRSVSSADRIHITVHEDFFRGVPQWLLDLSKEETLHVREHDVTQPLPRDVGAFEFVIHAAGIASPTYYRRYPIRTMDVNVNGLRTLLDYSRDRMDSESPVRGLLYFSSSEIYGDPPPDQIPTPEEYRGNVSCTGPRACYDESKRYGETLCVNFARQHGVPVKVARPFNNYGPGLKITDRRVSGAITRFSWRAAPVKPTTSASRLPRFQC
jgi:nucleoside-diphosphate-sugar epimerase